MFRKIFLSYFPEEESKNKLSPIQFHLKLLSPKLLYAILSKYSLNNRRTLQIDSKIHYFHPNDFLVSQNLQEENLYYSYKIFASLNAYNNYSIQTILATVALINFYLYYDYVPDNKIWEYLNPLLYGVNYLLLMFFSHFKEFPYESDKENLNFMIQLLEKIIFHLEYTKKPKQNIKNVEVFVKEIMDLIKTYPEFLMFLYNLSKKLYSYFSTKPYTDINLYEYLTSGNLLDFPSEWELRGILKESSKKIFLKRGTLFIDQDMITLLNVIWGDNMHISYFLNKNSVDFLPYFIDSLEHLENVSLDDDIEDIVEKTLDFKSWWEKFIQALKDFNSDNIDFDITPGQNFDKIQEMMTKEMMDKVKKVSLINEQFIDYFIFLIGLFYNWNSDNSQFEFLNNQSFDFLFNISIDKNTDIMYVLADKNYFIQSYFYKNKKLIAKPLHYYSFSKKLISYNILVQATKTLFSDFNKKTHIENISSSSYKEVVKKYFYNDIKSILNKWIEKAYLNRYFWTWYKNMSFTEKQISYFRWNIYYPDFLVWYQFLKFNKKKIKKDEILLYSRLKETLFGYLILRKLNLLHTELELEYINSLSLSLVGYDIEKVNFDLEWFYQYFNDKYSEFLYFFSSVRQNKEFINIFVGNFPNAIKLRSLYVWDNLRDISYYNKRLFKL
jgi:hypothetical protein